MDADDLRTWCSGIAGVLGLWLLASPFAVETPQLLRWGNVGTGAVVTALGWFLAFVLYTARTCNRYAAGFAALGGVWALLSPLVFGASGPLLWSNVAVGAAVAILFGYGLYADAGVGLRSGESSAA